MWYSALYAGSRKDTWELSQKIGAGLGAVGHTTVLFGNGVIFFPTILPETVFPYVDTGSRYGLPDAISALTERGKEMRSERGVAFIYVDQAYSQMGAFFFSQLSESLGDSSARIGLVFIVDDAKFASHLKSLCGNNAAVVLRSDVHQADDLRGAISLLWLAR